jgi:hypothetical protein
MDDNKMANLGQKIENLYLRAGYGRVLKSEIDAVVFHHFLVKELGDTPDYFAVDKTRLFKLSLALKLSEPRVKKLLEDDFYIHSARPETNAALAARLLDIVNHRTITPESLKDGKLRLPIANPLLRKMLEAELYKSGGLPDFSFNREMMVIEIYDFLRLLNFTGERAITAIIRKNILAKTQAGKGKEAEAFLAKLNEKPLRDRLKTIALGIGTAFLGESAAQAGAEIIGALIAGAKKLLPEQPR